MYLIKLRPFVSFQFINPDVTNAGNVFQVETGKFFADYDCNVKWKHTTDYKSAICGKTPTM